MPFVYRTELMDRILSSPQAWRIIAYMTPQYGEAYAMLWLVQAIGSALDMEQEWANDFIKQAFPQTATWSIEKWEKGFHMKPETWWTLEQRRQAVISRENPNLPMGPERLADIATNAAGIRVEIKESTGRNKFDVIFHEEPDRPSRYNSAAYTEIDRYKPSHLIYEKIIVLGIVSALNKQAPLLYSLDFHARADNLGADIPRFNGWHQFGRAIRFGGNITKGLKNHSLQMGLRNENRWSCKAETGFQLQNWTENTHSEHIGFGASTQNTETAHIPIFNVQAACRNQNYHPATLTKDSRWSFGQEQKFDGTRRFNGAGYTKEEL